MALLTCLPKGFYMLLKDRDNVQHFLCILNISWHNLLYVLTLSKDLLKNEVKISTFVKPSLLILPGRDFSFPIEQYYTESLLYSRDNSE